MKDTLYTRCPQCRTVFRITAAQLEARGGRVRCGQCRAVFQAKDELFETLPPQTAAETASAALETPVPAAKTKKHAAAREGTKRPRGGATAAYTATAATAGPVPGEQAEEVGIPTITDRREWPLGTRRRETRLTSALWLAGSLLLALLLVTQAGYFYREELARYPTLRPALERFCRALDCRIELPRAPELIELLPATRVEPHPRFENMLRIEVAMVNRAPFAQPYPWLELSLTDRAGNLIARRRFSPAEYLGREPEPDELLPADVVKRFTFDVTDPDGKSAGYEIRLVLP
jgi:predicted Zn finger-like uncharacterized protein